MTTQARILANRLNAQKSTGPRTAEGKAAVSQNALKHGFSARRDVIITESQEEFDLHREALLAELNPQTPMESILADRIVSLSWRLKRADQIQNQTFDAMHEDNTNNPLANLGKSFALKSLGLPQPEQTDSNPDLILGRIALKDFSNARVLDRLLMYERRIEHSLFKTTLELQRLRLLRTVTPTPPKIPTPAQKPVLTSAERTTSASHKGKICKTNPIPKTQESAQPLQPQRITNKNNPDQRKKTNPIKPNPSPRNTPPRPLAGQYSIRDTRNKPNPAHARRHPTSDIRYTAYKPNSALGKQTKSKYNAPCPL